MGQRVTTWDGQTWLLQTGALCLDFVHTGDLGFGAAWHDQHVEAPGRLDAWYQRHVSPRLLPSTDEEFVAALHLRTALTRIVHSLVAGGRGKGTEWDSLIAAAEQPDVPPSFPRRSLDLALLPAGHGTASIARDAVRHLRDHSAQLKTCTTTDCPVVFLDLSRGRSRQWCSMARCGNRAKVRKFRSQPEER